MFNTTKIPASFINELKSEGYDDYKIDHFELLRRLSAAGYEWHIVDEVLFVRTSQFSDEIIDTTNWSLYDLFYFLETY